MNMTSLNLKDISHPREIILSKVIKEEKIRDEGAEEVTTHRTTMRVVTTPPLIIRIHLKIGGIIDTMEIVVTFIIGMFPIHPMIDLFQHTTGLHSFLIETLTIEVIF